MDRIITKQLEEVGHTKFKVLLNIVVNHSFKNDYNIRIIKIRQSNIVAFMVNLHKQLVYKK